MLSGVVAPKRSNVRTCPRLVPTAAALAAHRRQPLSGAGRDRADRGLLRRPGPAQGARCRPLGACSQRDVRGGRRARCVLGETHHSPGCCCRPGRGRRARPAHRSPFGTHDDGDSIGLPSKAFFPAFGLGFLVVCVLLALLMVLDVEGDGRWFSLGFVVIGLVGLFIWWYTHGTVYHVSVEGMWRSRWPRRRVRWVNVTHVGLQRGRAEVVGVAVRTASLQVKGSRRRRTTLRATSQHVRRSDRAAPDHTFRPDRPHHPPLAGGGEGNRPQHALTPRCRAGPSPVEAYAQVRRRTWPEIS